MHQNDIVQALTGTYNALQSISVNGTQNVLLMAGVFQTLEELISNYNKNTQNESNEKNG